MIWTYRSTPMSSFATLPQPSIDITDLNDRTKWYKVDRVPYSISQQVNELCAPLNRDRIATRQSKNPHDRKAITVYVNKIGTNVHSTHYLVCVAFAQQLSLARADKD